MNKLRISERVCTPCSDCGRNVRWCHEHWWNVYTEIRSLNLCVCVYRILLCLCFSDRNELQLKSLFSIWLLSPQRSQCYFYLSIVSWHSQKYSTILKLVLCFLCVTPLVCSSYSSFAPSSPFFSSWWQTDCESFTQTLVLQCSPSTRRRVSPRRPDRFFNFYYLFRQRLLFASAQTLPPATTCSSCDYSLYEVWQTWAYSLVFLQLACWHIDLSRWSGGQPWWLLPFHCRRHCRCAYTSLPANFQCLHHVVLVPFCIICSLHLITVCFLQASWPGGYQNDPCNCHHFSPFISPRDTRVVQILPLEHSAFVLP